MLGSRFLIWVLAVFSVASALEIKNNFDTIRSWEFVARYVMGIETMFRALFLCYAAAIFHNYRCL